MDRDAKSAGKMPGTLGLPLHLVLTLVLAFAPIGALAATTSPSVMPAACGMMADLSDHEAGAEACCDAICAVVGSGAVPPTPSPDLEPVVFGTSVVSGFRSLDRTGVSSTPELPPPRNPGG